MGEEKLPTYFIKDVSEMESPERLHHFLHHKHEMTVAENWLPLNGELTFGVTAGASCPNNIVEEIILRAYELRGASADEVLGSINAESASDVAR
jgi:4-hydroxy-3-methylbut-2-enyl diphosphate reductase